MTVTASGLRMRGTVAVRALLARCVGVAVAPSGLGVGVAVLTGSVAVCALLARRMAVAVPNLLGGHALQPLHGLSHNLLQCLETRPLVSPPRQTCSLSPAARMAAWLRAIFSIATCATSCPGFERLGSHKLQTNLISQRPSVHLLVGLLAHLGNLVKLGLLLGVLHELGQLGLHRLKQLLLLLGRRCRAVLQGSKRRQTRPIRAPSNLDSNVGHGLEHHGLLLLLHLSGHGHLLLREPHLLLLCRGR